MFLKPLTPVQCPGKTTKCTRLEEKPLEGEEDRADFQSAKKNANLRNVLVNFRRNGYQ